MVNWEAVGALAELAGAIAVIGTLVYLSVQVKQSNATHETSTSWSITQALDAMNGRIGDNGELAEISLRGNKGLENLNEVELERYRTIVFQTLNLCIYIHEHPTPEHQFFVPFVAEAVQKNPGMREMMEQAAESIPKELYNQLTEAT